MDDPLRLAPVPFRSAEPAALCAVVSRVRGVLDPDAVELEFLYVPEGRWYRRRFQAWRAAPALAVRKSRAASLGPCALAIPFRVEGAVEGTLSLLRRTRRPWTGAEVVRIDILRPFVSQLLESAARLEIEAGARTRLVAAAEGTETPILLVDGDGALRYANRAAQALLAPPHDGGPGRPDEAWGRTVAAELARLAAASQGPCRTHLAVTGGRMVEARLSPVALSGEERMSVVTLKPQAALTLEDVAPRLDAHGISGREADVVGGVLEGLRNAEIATRLFISEWTVKDHLKHVFQKLGVSTRAGLLKALYEHPKERPAPRRRTRRPLPVEGYAKDHLKM